MGTIRALRRISRPAAWLTAGMLALWLADALPVWARQAAPTAPSVGHLESLEELAAGHAFYLLLEPSQKRLRLMLGAAELSRYTVQSVSIGRPRIAFIPRRAGTSAEGVFRDGQLRPPRTVRRMPVTPPPADAVTPAEPPPIPPSPEEAYPAPPRYVVAFDAGPTLDVRSLAAEGSGRGWRRLSSWWSGFWADRVGALAASGDGSRLLVVLGPDDAAALYRALPPHVSLFVCPAERFPCDIFTRPAF